MSSRPKREMRLRRIGKRNIHNSTCRSPMTAIVVRKGAVVATGVNKRGYRGSSIHAEMDALRQLRWQKNGAEGADLWLFRFGGHGGDDDRMSKPCSHCMEAICAAGITGKDNCNVLKPTPPTLKTTIRLISGMREFK